MIICDIGYKLLNTTLHIPSKQQTKFNDLQTQIQVPLVQDAHFLLIYKTSKVSLLQQAEAVTLSCLRERHHHPSHGGVVCQQQMCTSGETPEKIK
jgi:hypothetical protein